MEPASTLETREDSALASEFTTNGAVPATIPAALAETDRWMDYRLEPKESGDGFEKIPTDPSQIRNVSKLNPEYHMSLVDAAKHAAQRRWLDGFGFVVMEEDEIVVIDIDNCRDPETGEIAPWAQTIIDAFKSYTEVSPSGRGVHIWIYGVKRVTDCRPLFEGHKVEVYFDKAFMTVTGNRVEGTPPDIKPRQRVLDSYMGEPPEPKSTGMVDYEVWSNGFTDDEAIRRAAGAANGDKFCRVFYAGDTSDYPTNADGVTPDGSAVDAGLIHMIAFWTGAGADREDRTAGGGVTR